VSALRADLRLRPGHLGGIATYPADKLFQEVGFIAYHFHWSREEILNLAHKERHRWIKEISEINKKINKASSTPAVAPRASSGPRPSGGLDMVNEMANPYA
jgi:hypothetical protein